MRTSQELFVAAAVTGGIRQSYSCDCIVSRTDFSSAEGETVARAGSAAAHKVTTRTAAEIRERNARIPARKSSPVSIDSPRKQRTQYTACTNGSNAIQDTAKTSMTNNGLRMK